MATITLSSSTSITSKVKELEEDGCKNVTANAWRGENQMSFWGYISQDLCKTQSVQTPMGMGSRDIALIRGRITGSGWCWGRKINSFLETWPDSLYMPPWMS